MRKVSTILQVHTHGHDAYRTEGSGGLGEDKGRLPGEVALELVFR